MKKIITLLMTLFVVVVLTIAIAFVVKNETPDNSYGDVSVPTTDVSSSDTSDEGNSMPETSNEDSSSLDQSLPPEQSKDESKDVSKDESKAESKDESKDVSKDESKDESNTSGKKVISFLACPDNIMHTSTLHDALEKYAEKNGTSVKYSDLHNQGYDFDLMYKNVAKLIKDADISFINVETMIGGTSQAVSGSAAVGFNAPEASGEKLIDLGFDIMNLAHNHMLDSADTTYLKYCDKFFKNRGVTPIGYYPNEEDIVIYEHEGVKIAFLTYTEHTNGYEKHSSDKTVIPYMSYSLMKRQIKLAKEKADLVFVVMHWGDEDNETATNQQFKDNYYSNEDHVDFLLSQNVDLILGMHSHVIETCEWRTRADGKQTFITYSLGNFISGMNYGRNAPGALLSLDIVKDGDKVYIENPLLIPTVTHFTQEEATTSRDTGYRNFQIYFLEDYSEALAKQHGCHKKDDPKVSESNRFTYENIIKRFEKTIPEEFLPDYIVDLFG